MPSRWILPGLISVLLICFVACGGTAGSINGPSGPGGNSGGSVAPSAEFLYASLPSSNSIAAFQIDLVTGALTQVPGSPFPATGKSPLGMVAHPSGKFLYGVNFSSPNADGDLGTISAYSIGANGTLTANGAEVTTGSGIEPFAVAVNQSGTFVYSAASLSAIPAAYAVDSGTGQLTPLSTTRADFQDLFSAGGLVVTSGFVYESFLNGIDAFPIGADGRLTDTTSSPALLVGFGVGRMALGPGNKFIYAIGTGQQLRPEPSLPGTLVSVAISSTGTLSLIGIPLSFEGGSDVAVSGNFLFALNKQGIFAFAINTISGTLTQVPGSPFPLANQSGFLQADPSGKFLYAATLNSFSQSVTTSTIAAFSIDSAGVLRPVTGSPFALPAGVGGLAIAQVR